MVLWFSWSDIFNLTPEQHLITYNFSGSPSYHLWNYKIIFQIVWKKKWRAIECFLCWALGCRIHVWLSCQHRSPVLQMQSPRNRASVLPHHVGTQFLWSQSPVLFTVLHLRGVLSPYSFPLAAFSCISSTENSSARKGLPCVLREDNPTPNSLSAFGNLINLVHGRGF